MKDIRFYIPLTDEELEDRGIELSFNENELILSFDSTGKILKTTIKGTTYSISIITEQEELLLIDILNIDSKIIDQYSIKPENDDNIPGVAFKMLYGDRIIIKVRNEIEV